MDNEKIEFAIKEILIRDLQLDAAQIANADPSMPLLGRGIGLDSVEALRLALGLENAFDLHIPDAELTVELFASIGTLRDYVAQRLAVRKEPA